MSNFLIDNAKSLILKLGEHDSTRKYLLYSVFGRKIYWKHNNIKDAGTDVLSNLRNIYLPSLKLSKSEQFKKLFERIEINIPEEGFIFFIDEYKLLNSKGKVADNISVDYSKILDNSLKDLLSNYTGNDKYSKSQKEIIEAILLFIDRIIAELKSSNREDKEKFIKFFENIKHSPVSSFEESLQRILFFNQLFWQSGHQLNGFGRLDYVLDSIYKKDTVPKEDALKLIKSFLRCGHDYFYFKSTALPGDTGQIIVLGGKELNGQYFSNDLTYLFIQAVRELQLPDPKLILRYCDDMPRDLMESAVNCMSTGVGSPLISNDELIIEYLVDFGYDRKDACNYVVSACWEPAPASKGFEMNNIDGLVFLQPLESLLENENLDDFNDFNSFLTKYKEYLADYSNDLIVKVNEINWEVDPLLSLFIEGCDSNSKDLSEGGAKYNNFGLTTVGLSNTVNSLLNIKTLVFDEQKYTLSEINEFRLENFENKDFLKLLKGQNLKFGVDDETVIGLTNEITSFLNEVFNDNRNIYGGSFKFGLSAPTYISLADVKASFDGRRNGEAFNVHISYDDNQDYTELMRFASKLKYDKSRFNGNVVDFMVSPDFIQNNFDKFTDFLILSMKLGVFQLQLNVVSSETLIKAKENPEDYPNLIVRVWGFSTYFKDLPESYQDLLIKRAIENERKNN